MSFKSYVAVAVKRTAREALATALSKLPNPLPISTAASEVILKPSIFDPTLPANTSIEMIRALVTFFSEVSPISIVESDTALRSAEDAFQQSGYTEFERDSVRLLNLSKVETQDVSLKLDVLRKIAIPRILLDNIFLVNVATAKSQQDIRFGAGIKNLFGLLPQTNKQRFHSHLNRLLPELLEIFKPDLSIIDLTYVTCGKRSISKSEFFGGIILGTDPVAVDAYCAHIFGYDPSDIEYLQEAQNRGLGEALPDRIQVLGSEHQKTLIENICNRN